MMTATTTSVASMYLLDPNQDWGCAADPRKRTALSEDSGSSGFGETFCGVGADWAGAEVNVLERGTGFVNCYLLVLWLGPKFERKMFGLGTCPSIRKFQTEARWPDCFALVE